MTENLGTVCVGLWLSALLLLCRPPQASYRAFLSPLSCSSRRERREQRAWSAKPNKAQHNQLFLRQEHGFVETISRSLNDWGWQQLPGWFGPAQKKREIDMGTFFSAGPGPCGGSVQAIPSTVLTMLTPPSLLPPISLLVPYHCLTSLSHICSSLPFPQAQPTHRSWAIKDAHFKM